MSKRRVVNGHIYIWTRRGWRLVMNGHIRTRKGWRKMRRRLGSRRQPAAAPITAPDSAVTAPTTPSTSRQWFGRYDALREVMEARR